MVIYHLVLWLSTINVHNVHFLLLHMKAFYSLVMSSVNVQMFIHVHFLLLHMKSFTVYSWVQCNCACLIVTAIWHFQQIGKFFENCQQNQFGKIMQWICFMIKYKTDLTFWSEIRKDQIFHKIADCWIINEHILNLHSLC